MAGLFRYRRLKLVGTHELSKNGGDVIENAGLVAGSRLTESLALPYQGLSIR